MSKKRKTDNVKEEQEVAKYCQDEETKGETDKRLNEKGKFNEEGKVDERKKNHRKWNKSKREKGKVDCTNEKHMKIERTNRESISALTDSTDQGKERTKKGKEHEITKATQPLKKHYLIENAKEKSLLLNDISVIEENKLYVKNISGNITKEDLHNFFKNAKGYIETRTSYTTKGKIKNFAYIQFDTKENAENLLNTFETTDDVIKSGDETKNVTSGTDKENMENKENQQLFKKITIKKKTLLVSISKPSRTLYEPNIVFVKFPEGIKSENNVIEEKMQQYFAPYSFEIKEIRIVGTDENKHAYIEMKKNEDVVKCVEEIREGKIDGHQFTLNYSIPLIKKKIIYDINKIKLKREKEKKLKEEQKKEENTSTIFVSGLNFNTRKHKLLTLFGNIGEIDHINLSKKISKSNIKRNKGFAYVTFKNVEDATAALILNGTILDGKSIMVSKYLENFNNTNNYNKKNVNLGEEESGKKEHVFYNDSKEYINGKSHARNVFKEKGAVTSPYPNKFERNTYHVYEKKRINLSKNDNNEVVTAPAENFYNHENKKESDHPDGSMTNEDFRKLFLK